MDSFFKKIYQEDVKELEKKASKLIREYERCYSNIKIGFINFTGDVVLSNKVNNLQLEEITIEKNKKKSKIF